MKCLLWPHYLSVVSTRPPITTLWLLFSSCVEDCRPGDCSGPPDYRCHCLLGWTGADCKTDCGCFNHSTCSDGPGACDACQHRTTGSHCQLCRYGGERGREG